MTGLFSLSTASINRRLALLASAAAMLAAGTALAPAGSPAMLETGVAHAGVNDPSV